MNALKQMVTAVEWINKKLFNLTSLLFVPMTLIAVFEVTMRYLFNRPTSWAWDVNSQLFALLVIFGAAHTLAKGGHVVMDIVVQRFSKRTRTIINMCVYALFIFSLTLLVYQMALYAERSIAVREHASTLLAPPVYPLKTGMFIGTALLLLEAVGIFLKNIFFLLENRRGEAE
ncbi:MAG: TRAP transporter small permease subunit [Desulfobacterales bacterium]|nr:TRAP transporter small permease subunit [Desulfobacterales bacterium]